MWNQEKYQKAIGFAGRAHRWQRVPGTKCNYVVHLSNVAAEIARAICAEKIGDEDLAIQCALLHDVLEDTWTKPATIECEFGSSVLRGVAALSINRKLPNDERTADSLRRIGDCGREIACVKLADRITNLQEPPKFWDRARRKDYLAESIVIWNALEEFSPFLGNRLKQKIREYERYIEG